MSVYGKKRSATLNRWQRERDTLIRNGSELVISFSSLLLRVVAVFLAYISWCISWKDRLGRQIHRFDMSSGFLVVEKSLHSILGGLRDESLSNMTTTSRCRHSSRPNYFSPAIRSFCNAMHVWRILVVGNNASKRKPLHFRALYGRAQGKNLCGFNFEKNRDRLRYFAQR